VVSSNAGAPFIFHESHLGDNGRAMANDLWSNPLEVNNIICKIWAT